MNREYRTFTACDKEHENTDDMRLNSKNYFRIILNAYTDFSVEKK